VGCWLSGEKRGFVGPASRESWPRTTRTLSDCGIKWHGHTIFTGTYQALGFKFLNHQPRNLDIGPEARQGLARVILRHPHHIRTATTMGDHMTATPILSP